MFGGASRGDASTWRPFEESVLNQVGLDDLFDRTSVFTDCCGQGPETGRSTVEFFQQRGEDPPVDIVQPTLKEPINADAGVDGRWGDTEPTLSKKVYLLTVKAGPSTFPVGRIP